MSNAMYSPDLYINDEFKLSIKNGKNLRLEIVPGDYTFTLKFDKNYTEATEISLRLSSGKTYYIRVDTSLKIDSATRYKPYQRRFNMIEVDENPALNQITKCCLNNSTETKNTKKPESNNEKNSGHQFSIDKTQNPFSH